MKKLLFILLCSLLIVGCGKVDSEKALKEFETKVTGSDNYTLNGTMEIINNEDVYNYEVSVSYLKGDYYKVNLVNTNNDHEQVILKNDEGVYVITPSLNKSFKFQSDWPNNSSQTYIVITPSLNKSFKFQSDWPNNSSQTYILDSLLSDLKNDTNRELLEEGDKLVLKSSVNYPNNSNLVSQSVTFSKEMDLEKVEVFNDSGVAQITLVVTNLDLKANNTKEIFELGSIIEESDVNTETETTGTIENIIYPMYVPTGTTYSSEEKVTNEGSERVILTYTGEKPFIMIEETSQIPDETEVTAVNGELVTYGNIVGVMTDTSLNWSSNGMEYYLISSNMNAEELLQIAASTATVAVSSIK